MGAKPCGGGTRSHSGDAGVGHRAQVFLHVNNRSGNTGPAECQSWVCPVSSRLFSSTENGGWVTRSLCERKSGLGWSWVRNRPLSRAGCVESWVTRISGPGRTVTLQGQATSDCSSSRPAPQLFSAGPTGLGCPSGLGSASRMQTRRHKRLVLNPKRIPLWAPSRGNMAVHMVHPARATRPGTVTVQEALCSALAPVCERCPRPGGKDRRPAAEPRCCWGKVPAVCRELLVSWRVGVAAGRAGAGPTPPTPRPWPASGQQVCPGVHWDGVGRRQAGRGRQCSQETPLWGLILCCLRSKADTLFGPLGLGRLQPVSPCSWLGSDLSWEAASLRSLCF